MAATPLDALKVPARRPASLAARMAPLGEDVRRAVTALLRERAHHLRRCAPARVVAQARLAPVLLHASFDQRPFDEDAPGVAGLRYRHRWSSLARAFGLPPPARAQRRACAVDALVAIPSAGELEILAIVAPDTSADDLHPVQLRLDAMQRVLGGDGWPVRAAAIDPARTGAEDEAWQRILAFGALMAGRLAPAVWRILEEARLPVPTLTASALAARAPTPIATLALTLMTRTPCPAPLAAIVALLAEGNSPRALAEPDGFAVRWASLVPGLGSLLGETLRLAAPGATGGDAGARADRTLPDPFQAPGAVVELVPGGGEEPDVEPDPDAPDPRSPLGALVAHGRALAVACAGAIRASRLGAADRYTERLWREALGPGMPRLLLPRLGAALEREAEGGRLSLEPQRVGRAYEVRLPDLTTLARGATAVQARVRALALVAAAAEAHAPGDAAGALGTLFAGLDAVWRELVQRLARPRERPTLVLLLVAGSGARPGPPTDLLNRGPARALEFDGAVAVLLLRGRRPTARILSAEETVDAVLRRAPAGASLEVLASQSAAHPVAARLARIAALLRDPSAPAPVAIEAGGRVHLVSAQRTRVYPLPRFAARPRAFTPDPDAPDIAISTGQRQGLRSRSSGVVQCRVTPVDAHTAAILYADDAGTYLREVVPLPELEERLRDAREIVRNTDVPAVLAVRLADGLEEAVRRAGPPSPRVDVAVRGQLPWLEVEIGEERFGARRRLGWRDAAEALLARLAPGHDVMVGVNDVTVRGRRAAATPVLALYASTVARRRLRTHLLRAMIAYRTARDGRREG